MSAVRRGRVVQFVHFANKGVSFTEGDIQTFVAKNIIFFEYFGESARTRGRDGGSLGSSEILRTMRKRKFISRNIISYERPHIAHKMCLIMNVIIARQKFSVHPIHSSFFSYRQSIF